MRLKISEIRESLGIKQKELADMVGLSRPYMAQIENGTRNLTARKQDAIAKALGVKAADLVDFEAPDRIEEDVILQAFRAMTPEQRRSWLDLARVTLGSSSERQK